MSWGEGEGGEGASDGGGLWGSSSRAPRVWGGCCCIRGGETGLPGGRRPAVGRAPSADCAACTPRCPWKSLWGVANMWPQGKVTSKGPRPPGPSVLLGPEGGRVLGSVRPCSWGWASCGVLQLLGPLPGVAGARAPTPTKPVPSAQGKRLGEQSPPGRGQLWTPRPRAVSTGAPGDSHGAAPGPTLRGLSKAAPHFWAVSVCRPRVAMTAGHPAA